MHSYKCTNNLIINPGKISEDCCSFGTKKSPIFIVCQCSLINKEGEINWATSSEFGTYRLCEQRRFRRACASAQSHQNLRCSLIQAVSQEEPSDRKPDPWPLWMAGHAQLKFVMTECSKTQIRLTRLNWCCCNSLLSWRIGLRYSTPAVIAFSAGESAWGILHLL